MGIVSPSCDDGAGATDADNVLVLVIVETAEEVTSITVVAEDRTEAVTVVVDAGATTEEVTSVTVLTEATNGGNEIVVG